MPASTPTAAGEQPPEGIVSIPEALASNIRAYRLLRRKEQEDIAARMRSLGHPWRRATVSEVERARRNVTVSELIALTLVLGANIEQLLDPRGPERRQGARLTLQDRPVVKIDGETTAEPTLTIYLADGRRRLAIEPQYVTALVCSHKIYAEAVWDSDRGFLRQIDFEHGRPDLTDVGPEGPLP